MTYMDHVEVIVEKEMYARDGVHKGMQGWITEPENINGYWLVNFPQCGVEAHVNERIKVQFEKEVDQTKSFAEKPDDLSDYRI